jgi:DNA-dependent RNA polymerase auxiliary subunit epsilon
MAKYSVTINYERTQTILVEADSKDEAIELVSFGEFDDEQITDTEDENVEILGATCVDAEPLITN